MSSELERILQRAWRALRRRAQTREVSFRLAAYSIVVERVREAIELRGL